MNNQNTNNEINEVLLQTILQKNGATPFIKRFEITRNVISAGNNYCSEIMKVNVEYEINNECRKKFFILKVPFEVPAYKIFAKHGMYDKETFMYENILPIFHQSTGLNTGPKHYHTTKLNSLLLEDLGASGYKMEDRNKQLNFEESRTILSSLAVFHAASYHLHRMNPALIQAVAHETFFTHRDFVKERLEAGLDAWSKILQREQISSKFIEIFPTLIGKILKDLPLILSGNMFEFNVLNHGDLWTSNILFKRDECGQIEAAKMIDFQNCRWTSPANDIIIFATTSMKFDIFEGQFEELLQGYLRTLNQTLANLGYSKKYTMEHMKSDLEKAKLFRLVILGTYLNVTLSDPDSVVVFEKSNEENLKARNIDKTYNSENYKTTMSKWLKYIDKNELY